MWDVECITTVVTNKTISEKILLLLFLLYWKKKRRSAYYLPTHIFLSLSVSLFLHKTDSTLKFATFFSSKFITYHLMLWLQSIGYMIIRAFHLSDLPDIKMNRSPENFNSGIIYSLLCHYKPVWFYFFIGAPKMHTECKVLSYTKNYEISL